MIKSDFIKIFEIIIKTKYPSKYIEYLKNPRIRSQSKLINLISETTINKLLCDISYCATHMNAAKCTDSQIAGWRTYIINELYSWQDFCDPHIYILTTHTLEYMLDLYYSTGNVDEPIKESKRIETDNHEYQPSIQDRLLKGLKIIEEQDSGESIQF